jgi:hypothetical protein
MSLFPSLAAGAWYSFKAVVILLKLIEWGFHYIHARRESYLLRSVNLIY